MNDVFSIREGEYLANLVGEDHRIQIKQKPFDREMPLSRCIVIDAMDDSGNLKFVPEAEPNRPVFGAEVTGSALLKQTLLSILDMGYSPGKALDLAALELDLFVPDIYEFQRGVPKEELCADFDEMIDEMVANTPL